MSSDPAPGPAKAPLRQFRGAHAGIRHGLEGLRELPELAAALERARQRAGDTLALFDNVVLAHHAEEEEELFTAVQRSCADEAEAQQVRELVAVLSAQHRQVESLWSRLRPAVARVAAGKDTGAAMFGAEVDRLVAVYEEHAQYEEDFFLPLADAILRRNANHMAALDIALHLRHAPTPRAYI